LSKITDQFFILTFLLSALVPVTNNYQEQITYLETAKENTSKIRYANSLKYNLLFNYLRFSNCCCLICNECPWATPGWQSFWRM